MLMETKSMRVLEAHNKMLKLWEKRNLLISEKVKRKSGGTVMERVDDYRESVEEKEAIELAQTK